ncbi:MAG: HlyD family efflux transporter periplasmic adaptor subunit [Sutterellaceae bacterium]|nr:HlyD family efflux transporter periplasmic adaptor subunit [Sutterellaceae bacterium]
MKFKKIAALAVVVAIVGAVGAGLYWWQQNNTPKSTVAWGSVDVREVNLSFEASGRIAELTKEEGDRVSAGETIGRLDTELLEIQLAQAQADLKQLDAAWRLARDGFRSEDIAKAKASREAVKRELTLAQLQEKRQRALFNAKASSKDALDQAEWTRKTLQAQLAAQTAEVSRLEAGSRPDEVVQALAAKEAGKAACDALRYQIEKAGRIVSPVSGIVRTRLTEPGDMTSASRTVYQISITSPKWVRVYVSEAQLGIVKPGAPALVLTDTTAPLKATVGSVSSLAEFTPKTVQTQELRTALVYEVRLIVKDAEDILKLGQPVTVDFASDGLKPIKEGKSE